jgi:hypothetical protein
LAQRSVERRPEADTRLESTNFEASQPLTGDLKSVGEVDSVDLAPPLWSAPLVPVERHRQPEGDQRDASRADTAADREESSGGPGEDARDETRNRVGG